MRSRSPATLAVDKCLPADIPDVCNGRRHPGVIDTVMGREVVTGIAAASGLGPGGLHDRVGDGGRRGLTAQ